MLMVRHFKLAVTLGFRDRFAWPTTSLAMFFCLDVLPQTDGPCDASNGLLLQTEVLVSGFADQLHFSRNYRKRVGLKPRQDRIEGRVRFEFRASPMH